MKVGVKYCGGCNCTYDRGREVQRLKEQFPGIKFRSGCLPEECGLWLVVCGCARACVKWEELGTEDKVLLMRNSGDFRRAVSWLKERLEKEEKSSRTSDFQEEDRPLPGFQKEKRILRLGQEAWMTRQFFQDDVKRFAALTGDFNRIHLDAAYAADTRYGRPVVHGVLTASLISTLMGMELPGEGTVLLEERLRFLQPVFYGEKIKIQVRLDSCTERRRDYVAVLTGRCLKAGGETAVEAVCRQMLSKDLFWVDLSGEEKKTNVESGNL